ncbi:aldehyde ferredoxin oxidoreductase C-terminal domain-containing protein [Chloroflexota bacterium]
MYLFVYWAFPCIYPVADFMKVVTGREISNDELLKKGERISNLRQGYNVREGLNPLEMQVTAKLLGKLPVATTTCPA